MEQWHSDKLHELRELLDNGQLEAVRAELLGTHHADLAKLIEHMPGDEAKVALFDLLDARTASEVVVELGDYARELVLDNIQTDRLADIVDDMPSDEATDIIADLPVEQAREVLARIDKEDTEEVHALLKYPEDTAGGIMQLEMVNARSDMTALQVIEAIRPKQEEVGELYNVFVTDAKHRLVGVLPIFKLLLAKHNESVRHLLEPCQFKILAQEDQESVAHKFRHYDVVSAPVVDEHDRLLGRITIDDVMEIMEEETREDLLRMAGSSSEEDMFFNNRILQISRLRLPWLLSNLVGGLITGSFLWRFQVTLPDALFLLAFIPVITAMGGNVGVQSSTIMVRGFAVGHVNFDNLWRVLFKEFRVAMVMGLTCGAVVGLVARLWNGDPVVGIVVGLSMLCAISASSLMGTLAPALFKRLGVDPAISAGPVVTTANDIVGIGIYFCISVLFYKILLV